MPASASKFWYTLGEGNLMVKLPRKNAVQVIEADQARLLKLINETRDAIKAKTRALLQLQPNLTDMDRHTVELLLRERKVQERKAEGRSSDEDSDE